MTINNNKISNKMAAKKTRFFAAILLFLHVY